MISVKTTAMIYLELAHAGMEKESERIVFGGKNLSLFILSLTSLQLSFL